MAFFRIVETIDDDATRPLMLPPAMASSHRNNPFEDRHLSMSPPPQQPTSAALEILKPYFAGEPKSLSGIALRAFLLGSVLSLSLAATAYLALVPSAVPGISWREPFFLAALSAFHFLEFWTTAHRNTLVASIDSFLLTSNGPAYALAHSCAMAECLFLDFLFPGRPWIPFGLRPVITTVGLVLVVVGQTVRSAAMLQAGASFNHQVQMRKAESHSLVTTGVYAVLRHPSYFGFFYWGVGTQLVLGNVLCLVAYIVVLWMFFNNRILCEEDRLVEFFKEDYLTYRKRVGIWIPFIGW